MKDECARRARTTSSLRGVKLRSARRNNDFTLGVESQWFRKSIVPAGPFLTRWLFPRRELIVDDQALEALRRKSLVTRLESMTLAKGFHPYGWAAGPSLTH